MDNFHERRALSEGWECKRLGEIAAIGSGGTPSRGKREYWEAGTIPWVKISDISDKYILETSEKITNEGLENSSAKIFPTGTILISIFATLGDIGILKINAACNQALAGIQMNNINVNPDFLYYYLKTLKSYFEAIGRGVAQNNINLTILKSTKIPLPPLPTQRRIVSILEKAEETKRLRAQANELTDRLLQSVFIGMFGDPIINNKNWEIKTIEELSSEIVDCPHSTPNYIDCVTDFPCIRTTELKEGYIDWKKMKYLDEEEYNKRVKRLIPVRDDVIYGREGSFGEAVRIPDNTKISLGQRVMLFRPNSGLCNSVFLWALLRSKSIYFQASKKTSGSTVDHVNIKDIKKFKGICPPIELQNKFARIVEKIESMRQSQNQSKQQIEDLFSALMQKTFRGEI